MSEVADRCVGQFSAQSFLLCSRVIARRPSYCRVAEAITSNCIASVGKEVEEFLQEYAEKFVDKI